MKSGNDFRDHIAALLRARYDNVCTEYQLTAKKADIYFENRFGFRRTILTAVECKCWARALTRDDTEKIIRDYEPAFRKNEISELWIVCDQTPSPGARAYADSFTQYQLMTALECEQSLINFNPLLKFLSSDFDQDKISTYFLRPKFSDRSGRLDLHTEIERWIQDDLAEPLAIWGGYGMGKTSYARFLAGELAKRCLNEYGSKIPILLNLGDYSSAPSIENLILNQLTDLYGVKHFSIAAFRQLNSAKRFILLFDGFDEMKFAMTPNDFAYFSAELRRIATVNPKFILLGRPDAIQSEDEANRLLTSKFASQNILVRADEGPEFTNLRLAFFEKSEYLTLIERFLQNEMRPPSKDITVKNIVQDISDLDLDDILQRPVQSKMLAEIVVDPDVKISSLSRFSLYELFIKKVLRREEEKAARRHLSSETRLKFMRQLAWWLWTEKKTRTFAANEIPNELIQQFYVPGVSMEGIRRELLIGSILEERNVGLFLAEKIGGIFYFPHTSFTEFLVADYIMSADFIATDVRKLPKALYGEVPTFLNEHQRGDALFLTYRKMTQAKLAMDSQCLDVLLQDEMIKTFIRKVKLEHAEPWDICLRYFLHRAESDGAAARGLIAECLESNRPLAEFAGMFCAFYEEANSTVRPGSVLASLLIQILRKFGVEDLAGAVQRNGGMTARSTAVNHLVPVINECIEIKPREDRLLFNFVAFTEVALRLMGTSCAVEDAIEGMLKIFSIPANDLLYLANDEERHSLATILRSQERLQIIPTL